MQNSLNKLGISLRHWPAASGHRPQRTWRQPFSMGALSIFRGAASLRFMRALKPRAATYTPPLPRTTWREGALFGRRRAAKTHTAPPAVPSPPPDHRHRSRPLTMRGATFLCGSRALPIHNGRTCDGAPSRQPALIYGMRYARRRVIPAVKRTIVPDLAVARMARELDERCRRHQPLLVTRNGRRWRRGNASSA